MGLVLMALALSGAAQASEWKILPGSALTFTGTQMGDKFTGAFSRFDAKISLDPDHPEAAKIAVSVDLASAATGDRQRDGALPDKDWFDVAKTPTASFVATEVSRTEKGFVARGDLTLRGVTKKIVLPFTLDINGKTARAKGHADLLRNEFGVGQGDYSSDSWVAFQVGVDVDLVAERAE
ncbi:polyisoprenoid-binding protein YceI [Rhodoblastus acidophilus]|uniref:YceI family protein n=1 Tax=Rhodoblastus acidophilus TaxID=1074 RepID=UPI002225A10D|nr:YceI family protein [Rhodoblastus acidophilus]MCW2283892.1 polyisoprenoid-binding protein YceI [Rhodoblastus acidophilus]MCW2332588.1 polyisoprenoid-binding protein YceI [Rhodoblastus acidophilus]